MEPNPYEPPREPEPLTTGKVLKRGLGVGTIILLTPLAVAITFGASCAATYAVLDLPAINKAGLGTVIVAGFAVFLTPPVAVLIAMISWAIRSHHRNKPPADRLAEKS